MSDEAQTGHASPLLIDGDDGLHSAEGAQVIGKFAELPGGNDIASEKDEASGLHFLEHRGAIGIEFRSRNTRQ
jgi:hypothetical protein